MCFKVQRKLLLDAELVKLETTKMVLEHTTCFDKAPLLQNLSTDSSAYAFCFVMRGFYVRSG